jgi:UDP-N-acetylmuramoylalanine--D-glutamate ligase
VQVWDSRPQPPGAAALREQWPQVGVRSSAALVAEDLQGVDLVLKSPGLAPTDARVAPLLHAADGAGTPVAGELDLFVRALADLKAERAYAPKVLAITGTNGKTTSTAMCALLVARCGRRVAAAGNIGPTMLDTLADALAREPFEARQDATQAVHNAEPLIPAPQAETEAEAEAEAESEAVLPLPAETGADAHDTQPVGAAAVEPDGQAPLQLPPPAPVAPRFQALPEVWVLELSSFQLHGVQGFEPSAAAVLNLSEDHLDWHGSLEAYAADKARVYGSHAVMVVNRDDLRVEAMVPAPLPLKVGRGQKPRWLSRRVVRFGLDAPAHPGDFGLVSVNGMAWLVRAREVDQTWKKRRGEDEDIQLQRLMPADALRVRGRHNAANALAALALATAIGCPLAPMLHGLREYQGEPHRVALVTSVGGVEAFDDSKGTNVGATVAALQGLGADTSPGRLVLVLGGDGKGQDFSPLAAPVARHARAVALIGRDAGLLAQALADCGVPLASHASLEAAVNWCFDQARPGDAVLLSPACASLDMFRNYAHRAEVFVAAVKARAERIGEAMA